MEELADKKPTGLKKKSPETFELIQTFRGKAVSHVAGEDREYTVQLVAGTKYKIVDKMDNQVDAITNKVRRDWYDANSKDLTIK